MAGWIGAVASLIVFALVLRVLVAAMLGGLEEWPSWRWLVERFGPPPPAVALRSLAQVSADARRISVRYHQEGMRHGQLEGRRQAFDRVLAEAAGMVGVEHLLTVLPPGPERDLERTRLEALLAEHGVLSERAAG